MSHLERSGSKAGSLDGITDAKSQHWRDLVARGFSPTSLGTYSQCPMHYWMTHVLKIQGAKDSISKELPGRVWGEIVHHILCNVYQDLFKHGWPQQTLHPVQLTNLVNGQVNRVFRKRPTPPSEGVARRCFRGSGGSGS